MKKWNRLSSALLCLALLAACGQAGAGVSPPQPGEGSAVSDAAAPPRPAPSEPPLAPLPARSEGLPELNREPEAPPAPQSEPEQGPEAETEPARSCTLYILMYHQLALDGQPCNTWTVTESRFRDDLQWLADHGYATVLPRELAAGEPLPEKAVMLTFDDGYCSNYWVAYPLLQEYQAKAAIAVIARYVDEERPYYLTWPMCQIMDQSGLVEIGSHTYDAHGEDARGIRRCRNETREDYEARVFPDLQASIDLIEANVGTAPGFFAYPFGRTDAWAREFIRERFAVTVTTRHGSADLSNGLYGLNRFTVSMDTQLCRILPE